MCLWDEIILKTEPIVNKQVLGMLTKKRTSHWWQIDKGLYSDQIILCIIRVSMCVCINFSSTNQGKKIKAFPMT